MPKKKVEPKVEAPKKTPKSKNPRAGITRAKAIRLQCIECMGYQVGLVKDCPDVPCPLWPFRMGRGQEFTETPIRSNRSKK